MSRLFHRYKNLNSKNKNGISSIYISLFLMVLCMVSLAGTTWAWFAANQEVKVMPITAAEWKIEKVEIYKRINGDQDDTREEVLLVNPGREFTAEANSLYEVNITAKGTSSRGFIIVQIGEDVYCSEKGEISFRLCLSEDSTVRFRASWGEVPEDIFLIKEEQMLGDGVPEETVDTSESSTEESSDLSIEEETAETQETSAEEETTVEETTTEEAAVEETTTEEVTSEEVTTEEATTESETETSVESEGQTAPENETPESEETEEMVITE